VPPRLNITPTKDEAHIRRGIYASVEEMLNPGFLAQSVAIGGVNLSMRSLFPGEYLLLRHRIGLTGADRQWKEWAIAMSVWMLDGQLLLGDPNAPVRLRESLRSMPKSGIDKLFSIYTVLQNQVRLAVELIEAFCYEDVSRMLWRMIGRDIPSKDSVIGVPFVSTLGMNHVQRLWVAYNIAEDDRIQWQQEWAGAKLVASAHSPKGVRRLNQREDGERKLEEERRKKVIERMYYESTGKRVGEASGMVVYRSVTPEELVEEMHRWQRGEKDFHDLVVDSYKNQIRAKHEADRQKHEERMRALERLQTETGSNGGSTLVGYTEDQMRQLRLDPNSPLRKRGAVVASNTNATRLYQKYVERDIVVGGIGDGGKAIAAPKEMGQEGEGGTLNDVVASRRVHLSDDTQRGGG
jgi:hypothetical protein